MLLVDGRPALGIVVEVQLQRDDRKRFTWPVYVAGLRARLSCPACVLVVTPNESVAEWCRGAIDLGPGGSLTPLVVGPSAVPVVDDPAEAALDAELAVLSVMAHGHAPHAEAIARAALLAAGNLDHERALLYSDLASFALSEAARAALEQLMASGNYVYQSDFAKKHQATGRAQGLVEGLHAILHARRLTLSAEQRERVAKCTDVALIEAWIRKAAVATSADDVLQTRSVLWTTGGDVRARLQQ